MKDIPWWIGLVLLVIAGMFGGSLAWYGFVATAKNYDPAMAMVFGAATFGFIVGTAYGVGMSLVMRRYTITFRITRYSIRDLLIVLTVVAIALGIALNVLNKK